MVGLQLEIPEPQENEEDATDKQKAYIKALCVEVGASFPATTLNELGKWQASVIIDQLLEFKEELEGDEPLDTSRIKGLDSKDAGDTMLRTVVPWIVIIFVVLLVYLVV